MTEAATRDRPSSATELAQQLIRIPSENPVGTEEAIAEYVAAWLRDRGGAEVELSPVHVHRPNVIARLRSGQTRSPLVLLAHTDTVPAGEGWTHDAFGGRIVDGRLYGRGATDMKSGLAIAMTAFAHAADTLSELGRDLIFCGTVDEEGTHMTGATDLIDKGLVSKDSLIICTEPSNLDLVVSHKGVVWYEIEVFGKSAHAGNPHFGVDATYAAAAFVQKLRRDLESTSYDHPHVGRPTVTFSRIEGGIKTNVVPDYVRVELDVRIPAPMSIQELATLIGETASAVEAEIGGSRIRFRQINIDRPPVEADVNSKVVQALSAATQSVSRREPSLTGLPAYTDASIIAARTGNRDAIVFGPGRLSDAHTIDEYVAVHQVEEAGAILAQAVSRLCATGSR